MFGGSPDTLPTRPVYWGENSIVLSPMRSGLRMTSSVEFAGLEAPPDFRRIRTYAAEVRRALRTPPQDVNGEWLGFRPSMPDSLPVISRAPGASNCFLAFGHGHLGLTLGPITGKLIADMVAGATPALPLEPFSANRFG
jgi:D-amino-acid dehydrogenase